MSQCEVGNFYLHLSSTDQHLITNSMHRQLRCSLITFKCIHRTFRQSQAVFLRFSRVHVEVMQL